MLFSLGHGFESSGFFDYSFFFFFGSIVVHRIANEIQIVSGVQFSEYL